MRILVASDLSAASDEAVRQGLALAAPGNELALCHVLQQSAVHALFPHGNARELELTLDMQPRVAELLREQAARVSHADTPEGKHGQPLRFEIFVEQGPEYLQIANRATRWAADLLIVGSHGRTGVERFLLGSVAEHVVRHAPCTVLVAREHRAGCVLVATDLSEASLGALESGASEARRRDRMLVVVHVVDDSVLASDGMMAMLGTIPVVPPVEMLESQRALARQIIRSELQALDAANSEVQVIDGNPLAEILRLAETLPAELVVIGSKGQTGLPVVLGSTAADVVQNAPCSVLAFRGKKG